MKWLLTEAYSTPAQELNTEMWLGLGASPGAPSFKTQLCSEGKDRVRQQSTCGVCQHRLTGVTVGVKTRLLTCRQCPGAQRLAHRAGAFLLLLRTSLLHTDCHPCLPWAGSPFRAKFLSPSGHRGGAQQLNSHQLAPNQAKLRTDIFSTRQSAPACEVSPCFRHVCLCRP